MTALVVSGSLPAIQQPSTMIDIAGAGTGSGTAVVAKNVASGDVNWRTNSANPNAAIMDTMARIGGVNAHVVDASFPPLLSTGLSLTLAVSAGQCIIGGPVQIPASTVVVPDNTAVVFIYLKNDGTLIAVATSTTPPAGQVCLIGNVTTNAGAVTAVDYSGVLYLKGGSLYRETADTGAPTDTPPDTLLLHTKTAGGTYFWNGDGEHSQVIPTVDGAFQIPEGTSDPTVPGTGTFAWYRSDLDAFSLSVDGVIKRFYDGEDVALYMPTVPTASQILLEFQATRKFTLPSGLTGSRGSSGVASTAAKVFDIQVNGVSKGSANWAIGATTATFTFTTAVNIVAGDIIAIVAPATPDATLARIRLTLKGV